MSAAAYPSPLRAERGGLAASIDLPPTRRMSPAEISLTLSADVLRLPYPPATRLVLAEIVSLHAATGCCDASNSHFMARLSIKHDAVNDAIKRLDEDGLIVKVVDKAAGYYRTLAPVPSAIAEKATTNPYPEKPTSYSEKPTSHPSRKNRQGYSEKPISPSRENRHPLVGKTDTNTPYNIPDSFHQSSISSATASDAPAEKKIKEDFPAQLPADEVQIVPPVAAPPQPDAPRTRIASDGTTVTRIGPAKKAKAKPEGEPEHFAAFWDAYPRHDDRQKAVAAFARLSPEDQAAAPARAAEWIGRRADWISAEGKDYRPYPATWLNNKRWKDEPAPTPSPVIVTSHVHATSHSPRPINGHKPHGDGGSLARLLAECD